jgi:two-component system, sensor histidine kinase RpfC
MVLRLLRDRVSSRPDTEHMMSLNRVIFVALFVAYLGLARPPQWERGLVVAGLGAAATVAILAHLLLFPGPNRARRKLALAGDLAVTCFQMHLGGAATALFYPLLLWIILGNGLRFGIRSLIVATLMGVAGFALVVLTTPFWFEHASLSVGMLAGLVLIPVYAGALLKSLSRAKLAAEAANAAKTAFLASVSHELRTPLHAIIASGSLLQQGHQAREQAELTGTIMQAGKSLLGLINDLLSYSKIEAGGLTPEQRSFALPALLLGVREMLLAAAEAKGLRFALHVEPGTPLALIGDERHIEQVLLNLLSNAIKFTSFGGVLLSVGAVRTPDGGLRLRFQVTDTGIGIPAEAHQRIFERFTQADASIGARFGGTGLGLAICKGLVEQLGGAIGLHSQPGSGSSFWFDLPMGAGEAAAAGAPWPEQVIALGLDEAAAEALGAAAAANGATLRLAGFGGLDVAALLRASARRDGPLLVAAPASPAEMETLIAAARAASGNAVPALVIVGTPSAVADEARWVAPTLLPAGFGTEAAALAVRVALALARAAAPAGEGEGEGGAIAPRGPSLRILVADDNKLNQRVVGAILDAGGHRYDVVGDGEAALDALQANEYDLVLMDVNMPGIDGIEATKLYRVMALGEPHLPIIGVTADATADAAERCRDAGMDGCVVKPVTAQELLAAIARCVPEVTVQAAPQPAAGPRLRPVDEVVLDEARLHDLSVLGGERFVLDLLHGFAGEADELVDNIASALHDNNWPAFRASAHAIASSAANLGAVRVHHLAKGMERLGPTGMKASGRARIAELRRELERLQEAARAFEARSGAGAPPPLPGPSGQARAAGGGPAATRPLGYSAASWA